MKRALFPRVGGVCAGVGAAAAAVGWPQSVQASGGATQGDGSAAWVIPAAVLIGAGYLVLRVGLDRARQRVLWVPGVEHLLLGLLVGPVVLGLGLLGHSPVTTAFGLLAAAWVAASCGTEFNLRALSDPPRGGPRLGVLSALLGGASVTGAVLALLSSGWLGITSQQDAWVIAGWMGCAAAAASTAPLEAVRSRFETGEALPLMLRRSVRFSNVVAIVVFGVLACVFRTGYGLEDRPLSPVELAVVAVGLSAVLGIVMSPYLGRTESLAARVMVIASMIAFATGVSSWLGLSPLWVSLTFGAVVVNVSLSNDRVIEAVRAANVPWTLLLWVVAGALWTPPAVLPALAVMIGFVLVRVLGRMLASWIVAKWMAPMRADIGRGLLGQGEVAIALAVAFRIANEGPLVDIGYTAILASVVLHDVVAPWALRGLLLDAGELRGATEAKG